MKEMSINKLRGCLLCMVFGLLFGVAPVMAQEAVPLEQQVAALAEVLKAQDNVDCPAKPAGTVKLYRMYKKVGADHLYTTDQSEVISARRIGYEYEGIMGLIFPTQVKDTVPLYRLYLKNGADHFYTINKEEIQSATALGYEYEKIAGYVYPTADILDCWSVPFYRLYNKSSLVVDHLYTTDPVERYKAASQDGYVNEGIMGYLVQDPKAFAARKKPVVIIGGTYASEIFYLFLEARLKKDGYAYKFFELPEKGSIDIDISSNYLAKFIDGFLSETQATKVHLIGHSQGATVGRAYLYNHKAHDKVENMISLGGAHKGTPFTESALARLIGCPEAIPCQQLAVDSPYLKKIDMRPANDPVYYTNFTSRNDAIVPYDRATMERCDRTNVIGEPLSCNVLVQDFCPHRLVGHIALPSDAAVYSGIRQALLHQPVSLNCRAFF